VTMCWKNVPCSTSVDHVISIASHWPMLSRLCQPYNSPLYFSFRKSEREMADSRDLDHDCLKVEWRIQSATRPIFAIFFFLSHVYIWAVSKYISLAHRRTPNLQGEDLLAMKVSFDESGRKGVSLHIRK
jgi:hypothetical protein